MSILNHTNCDVVVEDFKKNFFFFLRLKTFEPFRYVESVKMVHESAFQNNHKFII